MKAISRPITLIKCVPRHFPFRSSGYSVRTYFTISRTSQSHRYNINMSSRRHILQKPFYSSTSSTDGRIIPESISSLTIENYHEQSDALLDTLLDKIELVGDSHPEVITDAEFSQGVLTIVIPKIGTYVINKQPPNKQIWLSSPISGPNRYDLYNGEWVSLRDGTKLLDVLSKELATVVDPAEITF
ncbi:ferroxidase Ecym_3347 [Eremothecium cymbalariae DBVPG|uniref:ferroxidase n=1 Tax=Eremothecium cymbalariae (strain CBS 270.75 / DBVPG 7215 / KCTC 17166 / NRRL Y-17582) TaxID=931890 RepID=G8JRR6_ERECY|nr:Hypothetical protein Ecym_3347 [Eremothecium cymbalariae DBVPG\